MARGEGERRAQAALLTAALLLGCNVDRGDAEAFLDRLESEDYRSAYRRAPGWETSRQPTRDSPHGFYLDIYINSPMSAAIDDGRPIAHWPEGSIVVVDAWSTPSSPAPEFLLVMEKPDDGEAWIWRAWKGAGDELLYAGDDVPQCVGCHERGEDQVRALGLPPL